MLIRVETVGSLNNSLILSLLEVKFLLYLLPFAITIDRSATLPIKRNFFDFEFLLFRSWYERRVFSSKTFEFSKKSLVLKYVFH